MFPSGSPIAVVKEKKSYEHIRRQKAENANAAGLEMAAECTIQEFKTYLFYFSEVFALKQVWAMTMSAVLSAVLPLLTGTEQTSDLMFMF